MLQQLFAIMDTMEFEDNGWLRISEALSHDRHLELRLDVNTGHEETPLEAWRIVCRGQRAHRLSFTMCYDIEVTPDHVLLWPHTMPTTSTTFYRKIEEPRLVVGALYQRHVELVANWIPFHQFLNPLVPLVELVDGTAGMLAQGPEPLVLAYESVLQAYGFVTSHSEAKPHYTWDGEQWSVDETPLQVLLLGESFVVAEAFDIQPFL